MMCYTPCYSKYGLERAKGTNAARGRVSESGRLSIPAEFRKAVGLDHGGDVVVELAGREIRIRTVDDFLAERHREAERECWASPVPTGFAPFSPTLPLRRSI
jgi:AbrB family looped-hinge helix DNA binding protein